MSIEEFAFYTGRSLASFKRDFAEVCDLSPQKWLIKKRLEKAHAMIQEGRKKINDIYLEVGFKNRSHFSIAYKKQYGRSPALSVN
ncbi:MAG: helix-turn-helix transcriptional regulator [Muribaculaceae bacterium]|nr:helix-turn-helix transcriptional regulator [Muribaculaceae bacterium]